MLSIIGLGEVTQCSAIISFRSIMLLYHMQFGICLVLAVLCQGHVYFIVYTVSDLYIYLLSHVPPVGILEGVSLFVPSKTGSRTQSLNYNPFRQKKNSLN